LPGVAMGVCFGGGGWWWVVVVAVVAVAVVVCIWKGDTAWTCMESKAVQCASFPNCKTLCARKALQVCVHADNAVPHTAGHLTGRTTPCMRMVTVVTCEVLSTSPCAPHLPGQTSAVGVW